MLSPIKCGMNTGEPSLTIAACIVASKLFRWFTTRKADFGSRRENDDRFYESGWLGSGRRPPTIGRRSGGATRSVGQSRVPIVDRQHDLAREGVHVQHGIAQRRRWQLSPMRL